MRIQEERHSGESWLLWKIGNWTAIDSIFVKSFGIAWLFKEGDKWCFVPRITEDTSLFYNAVFFIRIGIPCGIFWSIRWAEDWCRSFLQSSFGFKLNGRFTFGIFWPVIIPLVLSYDLSYWLAFISLFAYRSQSDKSSETGTTGPNLGQAKGFQYGPH